MHIEIESVVVRYHERSRPHGNPEGERQEGEPEGESLGSEDSPEHSGDSEDYEEQDKEVVLGELLQEATSQVAEGAQVGAQQAQEPAGATQDGPAAPAQEQAEVEDDLYDHSGEAFLQEQLEEEAAEGSAELRRSSSKGAAAPASKLVGAEPRIPRVQQGVRSDASGESTESALSHMSSMAGSMLQMATTLTEGQRALQAAAA